MNKSPPSILSCSIHNGPTFTTAKYYTNFNNYINEIEEPDDLSDDFREFTGSNGKCSFFNGTLSSSSKLRDNVGGFYVLGFSQPVVGGIDDIVSKNTSGAFVFIGDTNNEMDWTLPMPQGNKFSNVGFLFFSAGGLFQYAETRHKALNGSTYRNFQLSSIGQFNSINNTIGIIAPDYIVAQVENPSLTLADFISNIGGYLGIWGIFVFLFGRKKVDPFGFVSRFIFIDQDREKLLKELSAKLNISKEKVNDSVTETSNLSNQTGFKNLLTKYYIETNFYDHAVKTPDV
ncbi:hypothetical protein RclHR1_08310005 [Rhizophagus clarus]|nr:hypothetical protein RclHR1_08310005 [Rhizophagus clarus]